MRAVTQAMRATVDEVVAACDEDGIDAQVRRGGILRLARGVHELPALSSAMATATRLGIDDRLQASSEDDLIVTGSTPSAELPMVGHRSRRWEPEPLRWLDARHLQTASTRIDAKAARTGRAPSGRSLAERLVRHRRCATSGRRIIWPSVRDHGKDQIRSVVSAQQSRPAERAGGTTWRR